MFRQLLLTAVLLIAAAAPAVAKEYRADRFDVRIEVLPGGALRITETIVFTFVDGTFREVFRTIPTRSTDGIELVEATMDGRVLPRGDEAGQVEIRRKDGLRVTWYFQPTSASTHTFGLTYVARGVVRTGEEGDLLQWRALPTQHQYEIRASTIELHLPTPPVGGVDVERRRIRGEVETAVGDATVTVRTTAIRRNGWVQPVIRFARRSVVEAPPEWQQRQRRHWEMMPTWVAIAGGVFGLGLLLLTMLRQGYDTPPREAGTEWSSLIPPDTLPPALAGAVVTNGQPRLEHAMGALLSLAERGIVTIRELPRGMLSQRDFAIARSASPPRLTGHEAALLEVIFRRPEGDGTVRVSKARSHLMHHWKPFKRAVVEDLRALDLYDDDRAAHRGRYNRLSILLLVVAAVAVVPAALAVGEFGGWPMLIPAAIGLVALASAVFAAAETPLSNDGIRRAQHWRGYQRHLRRPQEIEPRWGGSESAEAHILPYAVALGLAGAWAKYMKKRGAHPPSWFQALSSLDSGRAFAAFIAYGGATAHASGAGVSGGVAGGGASGAR